jgi:Uma2 family endonuclease
MQITDDHEREIKDSIFKCDFCQAKATVKLSLWVDDYEMPSVWFVCEDHREWAEREATTPDEPVEE